MLEAALDAIAAHFAALDGLADAKRGWPEHPESLDLTAGPVATVTYTTHEVEPCTPTLLDVTEGRLKVADVTIYAQLDLWAAYRVQRDDAALVVEAGLHNGLPWRAGLRLESDYFERPITVVAGPGTSLDDEGGVTVGEWRRRWDLTITADQVVEADIPNQVEIVIRPTDDIEDPDTSLT